MNCKDFISLHADGLNDKNKLINAYPYWSKINYTPETRKSPNFIM